jgi:hypothetical protein
MTKDFEISKILNSYGINHILSTTDGYGTKREMPLFCFYYTDIDKKFGYNGDEYRTIIFEKLRGVGLKVECSRFLTHVHGYVGVHIELVKV